MNLAFGNPFRKAQPLVKKLSAQEAVKLVEAGEITLLDVRNHNEVASSGKAKGAIHIPLSQLRQQGDPRHPEFHKGLSADKPVAVYCASGARSEMARRTLTGFGFAEVHNIGGLAHWQAAGGKCVR